MRILLVSTQDYIHHPIPSRHHYIFEELAKRHEVHVPHFHVSRGKERETRLIVHEATKFPVREPILHYTLNAPFPYAVFKKNNLDRSDRITTPRLRSRRCWKMVFIRYTDNFKYSENQFYSEEIK